MAEVWSAYQIWEAHGILEFPPSSNPLHVTLIFKRTEICSNKLTLKISKNQFFSIFNEKHGNLNYQGYSIDILCLTFFGIYNLSKNYIMIPM